MVRNGTFWLRLKMGLNPGLSRMKVPYFLLKCKQAQIWIHIFSVVLCDVNSWIRSSVRHWPFHFIVSFLRFSVLDSVNVSLGFCLCFATS